MLVQFIAFVFCFREGLGAEAATARPDLCGEAVRGRKAKKAIGRLGSGDTSIHGLLPFVDNSYCW